MICERAGRHRYYKLASPQVAGALEASGLLSKSLNKTQVPRHKTLDPELCFARTCYDHLAGKLGVKITNALLKKKLLVHTENSFEITPQGEQFFKKHDINVKQLQKNKRHFAKPCLDWTEREYHLAGSLGSALLTYFLENRLILRSKKKSRVIVLTTKGKQWLYSTFSLQMEKK